MARDIHVGVLAIQGAFLEHINAVRLAAGEMGVQVKVNEVRSCADLTPSMDGLIIPGGESTAISLFLKRNKMEDALRTWTQESDHVTYGTCAGMIMLSDEIMGQKRDGQPHIGGLPVVVHRNYFGRQVNSFEASLNIVHPSLQVKGQGQGVFIRAPVIERTLSDDVIILATVEVNSDVTKTGKDDITQNHDVDRPKESVSNGLSDYDPPSSTDDVISPCGAKSRDVIVGVRHGNLLGTAFHPELTDDLRWHTYFLKMIIDQ